MSNKPRTYVIGLPVSITVHDDGRVTYTVHIEDAAGEVSSADERFLDYSDADVDADVARIEADADAHGTDRTTH